MSLPADTEAPAGALGWLVAAERLCCQAALAISGVLLVVLMLLSGGNVLLRLLGRPSGASYELSGFCGALVAALALAETQRMRRHITGHIVTCLFPGAAQRLLHAVNALIGVGLAVLIASQLVSRAALLQRAGEVSETLKLPYSLFMCVMAAGLLLLALSYAVDLFLALAGRSHRGACAP